MAKTSELGVLAATIAAVALLASPVTEPAGAAPPGVNGKIVFTSTRHDTASENPTYEIYAMDPDGTGTVRLTTGSGFEPSVSGAGRIAYTNDLDGAVHLMDATDEDGDGRGDNPATIGNANGGGIGRPTISPDGQKIAYQQMWDGGWEIFVMDAADRDGDGFGDNPTRLTDNFDDDTLPAWSPDGQKIAFTSYRDRNGPEIYAMDADGTNQTRLTDGGQQSWHDSAAPDFSPDGGRIVFVGNRGSNAGSDVYAMNADGTGEVRLTNDPGVYNAPAFSPDGTKIVFHGSPSGQFGNDVFVMDADGTDKVRLTDNEPAHDMYPV